MQCARILISAAAIVALVHACEPNDEVCHGCTAICSHYVDDTKLVQDPHCWQRCQADVYNCIEGTLPQEEALGDRTKCIQEALLTRVREDGDLITKITYDTPPSFEELDQLHQEDGRIDERDMAVATDILDGGAAPDGTVIPTAKVNVLLETFREADQDGDSVVTEGEFNAYARGKEHMGHEIEEQHPTPKKKKLEDEAETMGDHIEKPFKEAGEEIEKVAEPKDDKDDSFVQVDVDLMQSAFRSPKKNHKKAHRRQEQKPKKKVKQTGLAYFQHLFRLGLRVHRAEERVTHPIGSLALKMYKAPGSETKDEKPGKDFL